MKVKIFFTLFLILSAQYLFAQSSFVKNLTVTSERGANEVYVHALVDSTGDTLTTDEFDLSLNNGSYNIPIFAKKLFTSIAGKPRIKIVRQEYAFGSWRDAKTLYTNDSTETYQDFAPDTLRATRNRWLIMGATGNRSDSIVKFLMRFLKIPY
jgi:hypothetical protein